MIDRASRNRYATILRHLASGTLSTDRFQSEAVEIVLNTHDPLLADLHQHVDGLYHDLWSYTLRGRDKLDAATRRQVARTILLLRSEEVALNDTPSLVAPPGPLGWLDALLMSSAILATILLIATLGFYGVGLGVCLLAICLTILHHREIHWWRQVRKHAALDQLWPFSNQRALDRAKRLPVFFHGHPTPSHPGTAGFLA